MSIYSEAFESPSNIYEDVLNEETTCDFSSRNLEAVPEIKNKMLCVLYLQNNKISSLPSDFFPSLPSLKYLDLRDNELTDIPNTILNHPCLTHLLLQNNRITALPNELGTVYLKVLQLNGNSISYPPLDVLKGGVNKVLEFLHNKYIEFMFSQSQSDISEDATSANSHYADLSHDVLSYNSVIDGDKIKKSKTLSIQFSEREVDDSDDEQNSYRKIKGKCPKLAKSRHQVPTYCQSSKYVAPSSADSREVLNHKIKQSYFQDLARKKHKDFLAKSDKVLQGRKNFELLKNWRKHYCYNKQFADSSYKMHSKSFPYDTSPEYMTLLTREDIEKDLPNKYKKNLVRRSKPTVPRKNKNDVHLALQIKQLFENLEAIDLNKGGLTPRTEQRVLLSEIQKITEIKKKLTELSATNGRSAMMD